MSDPIDNDPSRDLQQVVGGPRGAIDDFRGPYRWLSNFEILTPSIHYEGLSYPSTEHAYQAQKVAPELRRDIACLTSPGRAMRRGRALATRHDWASVKLQVMEDVLRLKFDIPRYRAMLVATGDRELIEGNTWGDVFWGVCDGSGENNLGKLLMKIRAEAAIAKAHGLSTAGPAVRQPESREANKTPTSTSEAEGVGE